MNARITATLTDDVLAALDAWIAREPAPRPSREEALATAVCEWLAAQKLVAPDACSDAAHLHT